MLRTTPFHDRIADLNRTQLWSHWSGYLVVDKFQMSEKFEYFAIRNAVGVFDNSPLYKYRIAGADAERYLAGVLARDIRTCRPGHAQYTIWCDDRGFVNEDGVILRTSPDEFILTAAEPNLAYFQDLIGYERVDIEDVTDEWAALSVQGPRSRHVLSSLAPEIEQLGFFGLTPAKVAGASTLVSRTGFTGDLGYELMIPTDDALTVWDAVMDAGRDHRILPFGQIALLMARIEAGLLLIRADFEPSRYAMNDEHRSTPHELGLGWMLKDLGDRSFIGRRAIEREVAAATSRWKTVGLRVDPGDHTSKYTEAGLVPPKDHTPVAEDMMVYDDEARRVGYATSFMYSPMLQTHIALAKVKPEYATIGTKVNLEFTINHQYTQVAAHVARNPMFNPERKTA
ncbi:MAG: aminomethyltransferase family protein [Acidimicrobiia bacterium]|nr:aminomethyltransferase family protein [Acidimicrobiia bacterium]